jgi:hypothetical protein
MANKKITDLPEVTAPLESDLLLIVSGGATKKITRLNLRGYKAYTVLLTQQGANAPVATVLENSLGATITWVYDEFGFYRGVASSAVFVSNKTFLVTPLKQSLFNDENVLIGISPNTIEITTHDNVLENMPLGIRVYS